MHRQASTADGVKRSIRQHWSRLEARYQIVFACFLATFTAYVERVGFSLAFTAWAKEADLGEGTKGTVLSAFFWGYAVSQVPPYPSPLIRVPHSSQREFLFLGEGIGGPCFRPSFGDMRCPGCVSCSNLLQLIILLPATTTLATLWGWDGPEERVCFEAIPWQCCCHCAVSDHNVYSPHPS